MVLIAEIIDPKANKIYCYLMMLFHPEEIDGEESLDSSGGDRSQRICIITKSI